MSLYRMVQVAKRRLRVYPDMPERVQSEELYIPFGVHYVARKVVSEIQRELKRLVLGQLIRESHPLLPPEAAQLDDQQLDELLISVVTEEMLKDQTIRTIDEQRCTRASERREEALALA